MSCRNRFRLRCLTIVLGVAVAAPGCHGNRETTRVLLKERQAEWTRQLSALMQQQAELKAQLGRLPTGTGAPDSARARVAVILDGSRQSLADLDVQVKQVGQRVQAALAANAEAGMKAFDDESIQMRQYLNAMGEQLGSARRQLGESARSGESNSRGE